MDTLLIEDKRNISQNTSHRYQQQIIKKNIESGKISIFSLAEFPYSHQPFKFTPFDLKRLFDEYSLSTIGINKLCSKHGIREQSVYILIDRYSELRAYYERCIKQKATVHNEKSVDLWEEPLNEDEYETTKYGKKLNYASVVFRDRKSQMYARQAALLDRDRFGDVQRVESTVKSFNISRVVTEQGEQGNKTLMDLFTTFQPK